MMAVLSAPVLAKARISSRNLTSASSAGAIASSALARPPVLSSASAPISPNPIPPECSATPRHARVVVTKRAAESTRSGRTSAALVLERYTLVAETSSFSVLTVAGVLMLSSNAACTPARATSIAEDKARSCSPQVCSWSTEYPPGVKRITPLTWWKNSTKTFSIATACSICANPTTRSSPVSLSRAATGVRSMGSHHWCSKNKNRICLAEYILSAAPMVMKFLSDLDILSPSMCRCPVCTNVFTHCSQS
mmetsp:Transcript_7246/g.30073  ORF Transcript_7246/g.30073 Transcript_7246/m.30073 type:complete len:250 (-) Transcript_7246:184-933(-)